MNKKFLKFSKKIFEKLNSFQDVSEVVAYLKKMGLWQKEGECEGFKFRMQGFGQRLGAWSTASSLNENAMTALNEQIDNSRDEILRKRHHQTNPQTFARMVKGETVKSLPKNLREAMKKFMGRENYHEFELNEFGKEGNNVTKGMNHWEHSEILVTMTNTNTPTETTIAVQDFGKGQSLDTMKDTLLSASDSNKLKIPYLKGRHQQGGTAIYPHLGGQKLRLIASKLNPKLAKNQRDKVWSVAPTMVLDEDQLEDLGFGMVKQKAIVYYEFRVDGNWELLHFDGTFNSVHNMNNGGASVSNFDQPEYGCYIKMYNVQLMNNLQKISHYSKPKKATPTRKAQNGCMGGSRKLQYVKSLLNILTPFSIVPVRIFHPDKTSDYKEEGSKKGGHTSTLFGLEYTLQNEVKKGTIKLVESQEALFLNKVPCQIDVYHLHNVKPNSLVPSGIVWTLGDTNNIVEKRDVLANSDFSLGYIKDDIFIHINIKDLSTSEYNEFIKTSREGFHATEQVFEFRKFVAQKIQSIKYLQDLIQEKRMQALGDVSSYKPVFSQFLDDLNSTLKTSNNGNGGGCTDGNIEVDNPKEKTLDKILKSMVLYDKTFKLRPDLMDKTKEVKSKLIDPNQNHFSLYFITNLLKSVFDKYGIYAKLSISYDGENWNSNLHNHTSIRGGDGYINLSLDTSSLKGQDYYLKITFKPKNPIEFDHDEFEFMVNCVSMDIEKREPSEPQGGSRNRSTLKGGCDIQVVAVNEQSEYTNYCTGYDSDNRLLPMNDKTLLGYTNLSPEERIYAVNLNWSPVAKWLDEYDIKNNQQGFDRQILISEIIDYSRYSLRELESNIQSLDVKFELNLKELNYTSESWFYKFKILFDHIMIARINKAIKKTKTDETNEQIVESMENKIKQQTIDLAYA
jgi:hypothetical protein